MMVKWNQDQKIQLLQLVCDYKFHQVQVDWEYISQLFLNHSVSQLQQAYQNSIRKQYSFLSKKNWSQKEIQLIRKEIDGETINWYELRKKLPDFSMNDIIQKVRQTIQDCNDLDDQSSLLKKITNLIL